MAATHHGHPDGRPLGTVGTTWRSYVAEVPAWALVVGAMAVSFWSQVEVVTAHSFAGWEGLIFAASSDFGTVACLFMAREGAHRGTPTWGAWALSVGCAAVSVEYNVVRDWGDWLGVEAHLWMPIFALGVWWWLLHGRHRRWARRSEDALPEAGRRLRDAGHQLLDESIEFVVGHTVPDVPAARNDDGNGETPRRTRAQAFAHFAGRAPTWQEVRDYAHVPRSTAMRWADQIGQEAAA